MYLLDRMESAAPPRRTVYRISLTLVKRESLEGGAQDPKGGRQGVLLEEVQEEVQASHGYIRNFRTFSTGQLELGRKLLLQKEEKETREKEAWEKEAREKELREKEAWEKEAREKEAREKEAREKEVREKEVREKEMWEKEAREKEMWEKEVREKEMWEKEAREKEAWEKEAAGVDPVKRRLLKARSVEERSSPPQTSSPEAPPPKRAAGLLRRSFRHRPGGEPPPSAPPTKSRTLEAGAVLNTTGSTAELRGGGAKSRTLDNSDLTRPAAERGVVPLRGGAGERRLVRFFSGIFSRRDGAASPSGSPASDRPSRAKAELSTGGVNGGRAEGNCDLVM